MRKALLLLPMILICLPRACSAEETARKGTDLTAFLETCQKILQPLDAVYEDLESENLPLLDESGQPLGHRPLENRRRALAELRHTVEQLQAEPENLVPVTTLFIEFESLTDDLYDLSQIAYDYDREDLGRRLAELVSQLDDQRATIESYTLSLAGEKESRLRQLEDENRNLHLELERVKKEREARPGRN